MPGAASSLETGTRCVVVALRLSLCGVEQHRRIPFLAVLGFGVEEGVRSCLRIENTRHVQYLQSREKLDSVAQENVHRCRKGLSLHWTRVVGVYGRGGYLRRLLVYGV